MVDEPDNLMLHLLRRIDAGMDRLSDEFHNFKIRLTAVEEVLAGVNRRLDSTDMRLDRIEKRLDLVQPILPGSRE